MQSYADDHSKSSATRMFVKFVSTVLGLLIFKLAGATELIQEVRTFSNWVTWGELLVGLFYIG